MNKVHRTVGATVGAEERGACMRVGATKAPKHFRWDYPGPAAALDRRPMDGGLQVSVRWGRISQPDGQIHRRPVYTSSRPKGPICDRGLLER